MNIKVPLLSICIPTYNRHELLFKGLSSIIEQINDSLCQVVEIVVSDNASQDHTREIVTKLQASSPNIRLRYFRHSKTINANANIYHAARLGVGTYIYIISDDDVILPGAIAKIVTEIERRPELDALCPNWRYFEQNRDEQSLSVFMLERDRLINDQNEALRVLRTMLTFVSCIVFRRDISLKRNHIDKITTFFPHSYFFLDVIRNGNNLLMIQAPCLAVRGNSMQGVSYDLVKAFIIDFMDLLKYAKQIGYSRKSIRSVLDKHANWFVSLLYSFRNNSYSPIVKKRIKDSFEVIRVWWWKPQSLVIILCAMWLPYYLIPSVRNLYFKMRNTLK